LSNTGGQQIQGHENNPWNIMEYHGLDDDEKNTKIGLEILVCITSLVRQGDLGILLEDWNANGLQKNGKIAGWRAPQLELFS
jgi:hypothetical protein